jgi:hypothetical protein
MDNSSTEQAYDTATEAFQAVVEFDKLNGLDHGRVDRRSLPTGGSAERLGRQHCGEIMNREIAGVYQNVKEPQRLEASMVARS